MRSGWLGKKAAFSLLMFVPVAVVGLVVAELAARHFRPDSRRWDQVLRQNLLYSWARADPDFHHVGDAVFALRFPAADEAPRPRVMIVGDSFAMGHGVAQAGRFGALLQQALGAGTKVDVFATSSYSPVIERNIVRKALGLAAYRAVALFVDQTDSVDDWTYQGDLIAEDSDQFDTRRMTERVSAIQAAANRNVARLTTGLEGQLRRLTLVNLLWPLSLARAFPEGSTTRRYIELSLQRSQLIRLFNDVPDADATRKMEQLLLRHVDEIVATCGDRQVPLVLSANPWEFQTSPTPRNTLSGGGPYPRRNRLEEILIERYGNRPGVTVMLLTATFREQRDVRSLYLIPQFEVHWSAEGHALAERALRTTLLEHHLVEVGSSATP